MQSLRTKGTWLDGFPVRSETASGSFFSYLSEASTANHGVDRGMDILDVSKLHAAMAAVKSPTGVLELPHFTEPTSYIME